jgi:hypothetical protein
VYLAVVALINWGIRLDWNIALFLLGGVLGVYFLDAAEEFFAVNPSPFRSIFFIVAYSIVSFFVVSSSASAFAGGLVLSLYLQVVLWQAGELRVTGHMDSWYRAPAGSVPVATQKTAFACFVVVLLALTYFFIHF